MSLKNLLYLHSHDMGRALGPCGVPMRTPHLQRFAEEGVLFRKAFAAAPTCSPSRAAFLTGCTPHQNGQFGLTNQGWGLKNPDWHLARYLSQSGFRTITVSNDHVHELPVAEATEVWQEVLNHESMPTYDRWLTADIAVERIQKGLPSPFSWRWDGMRPIAANGRWSKRTPARSWARWTTDTPAPFPIYEDNPGTRREAAMQGEIPWNTSTSRSGRSCGPWRNPERPPKPWWCSSPTTGRGNPT